MSFAPSRCAPSRFALVSLLLASSGGLPPLAAKPASVKAAKKPITHEVYQHWKAIREAVLSRDGRWLAYVLTPQEGDSELVVRRLTDGQEFRCARGMAPVITADARFVAFTLAPPKSEVDKAKKEKKKPDEMPKTGLGVMDLATGKVETLDRVKSFGIAEDGGRFLAALMEAPKAADKTKVEEKKGEEGTHEEQHDGDSPEDQRRPASSDAPEAGKKENGTDLVLWELGKHERTTLAAVSEYVWSKDGRLLAYATSVKEAKKEEKKEEKKPAVDAKEGAFLRFVHEARTLELNAEAGTHKGFAFDDDSRQLAFLSAKKVKEGEASVFRLLHWREGGDKAIERAAQGSAGLPEGFAPSGYGKLDFSKDGLRLYFGTNLAPRSEPKGGEEPAKVDLWHWKDPELQTTQKVKAEEEKKRSLRAVLHLAEGRLVQLGSRECPEVEVNDNAEVALAFAPDAYRPLASWDQGYADVYAVELKTGVRRLLASKLPWRLRNADNPDRPTYLSPGGRYLCYFDREAKAWKVIPTSGGEAVNLTAGLKVAFQEEDHDLPGSADSYGRVGWTSGDRSLVVYDRYDLWELRPGQEGRSLTQGEGRKAKTSFRYQRLDPKEKVLDLSRPLVLTSLVEESQATGYAQLDPFKAPRALIQADRLLGARSPLDRPTGYFLKAKDADVVLFTQQRFDLFPDLYLTDLSFSKPRKVTDANPQQAQFNWGRQELMTYRNGDGKERKALLVKPEDFDPAKKYPMMVYLYETYSPTLHVYQAPAPGTSINFTRYASNGYLVLRPDIIFDTEAPGLSSLKHVLPAVGKVLEMGIADPDRLGIQGHSWGGYQILYLLTRTNLFKAAEAGAAVSNMTSAYGGIRWGTGLSRAFQYEKGQSRMGDTPWNLPLAYLENSPLFWVERVQTPVLLINNDEDDAVPWTQGIEFFSALRRLGKPCWMFNFNGDKHNLANRENQKYWTLHMAEYFDHLLKGAPRPAWMDQPVPYGERGKREVENVFKGEGTKPSDR